MEIKQESLFIPLVGTKIKASEAEALHVRHIWGTGKKPALLVHGAIENGRIFYSESGKGFASYLARNGFDVYVLDLRGRGRSQPHLSRGSAYGQNDSICEEIPLAIRFVGLRTANAPQTWVGHSWAGVLLLCVFARFPELRPFAHSMVFFGSKRCVRTWTLERLIKIELFWKGISSVVAKMVGYLPAVKLRMGSDDETVRSHAESRDWVRSGPWIDPTDGFDYGSAIKTAKLPPCLFLAGRGDKGLGNPRDVADLMAEAGGHQEMWTMGRETGFLRDYGHVEMMVHRDAERDHFPRILRWMRDKG